MRIFLTCFGQLEGQADGGLNSSGGRVINFRQFWNLFQVKYHFVFYISKLIDFK